MFLKPKLINIVGWWGIGGAGGEGEGGVRRRGGQPPRPGFFLKSQNPPDGRGVGSVPLAKSSGSVEAPI